MRLAIKTPTREFEYTARDGAANIVIGNRTYDDLPITDDPGVSGPHVRLEFFIGKWTFSDQFSGTGTIHNGSKKSSGELAQGDVLTLGGTTLRVVELAGKAAASSSFGNAPGDSVSAFEVPDMPKADTAWPPPAEPKPAFSSNDPGSLLAANVSNSLAVPPSAPLHAPAVTAPGNNPADMPRTELVDMLFAALVEAAKREDGLDVSDTDKLKEYRELAERGVAGTSPARVAWVHVPLLVTGDALNFDVEDDLRGELEGAIDDLTESERKLYDFLLAEAERVAGRALSQEALVRERLADAANDADSELDGTNSVEVKVPWLSANESGPVHLCLKISTFAGNYRVDATLPAPAMPALPAAPSLAPQTLREIMAAKLDAPAPSGANEVFVQRIADRLAREFLNQHGTDPRRDPSAAKRLNEAAHKAVIELEHTKTTQVNLPFLMSDPRGPLHLDVELHRRHLHERADDEVAPHRTPPSSSMQVGGGSAKKGNAAGIVVVVVIILVSVGAAAFGALSDQSDSEAAEAEIKKTLEEGNRKAEAREEMRRAIREISRTDNKASPEQQLHALRELKKRADAQQLEMASEFDSADRNLQTRVYADLARKYDAASRDVRLSLDDGKLAEADDKRAAFMKYVQADTLRLGPAKTLQIEQWNTERVAEIEADNKRLIADKLEAAEYALELKDYAKAAECIGAIADGAILKGTHRAWMQTEQKAWQALATQQAEGKLDPPLKRAPERPKLPAFPRNDLLPLGGTTVARNLSALQQRVTTAFREGTMNEVATTRRGHKTVAFGVPQSSVIRLVVSRPYLKSDQVEQVLEYEALEQLRNMPDDAQLGLLWAAPDKTLADWLGILHFCFDRGFADKAGEAALQIRWLSPEKTRELDELLAAKWAKPIPTGGFPERDGRIVPE